jgi:hypothetical protein
VPSRRIPIIASRCPGVVTILPISPNMLAPPVARAGPGRGVVHPAIAHARELPMNSRRPMCIAER